ncbi:hypothetical protein [Laspinema olomoucense]|uniref:hypothetical protein n=1 Tax=Laspinema olomoucense TaxID=3231600 RepID=UPI0021BA3DFA|nr:MULTISPECIES: hypothetical protein [unclassified Laspinema]MCT7987776.1 hypothetical protein [Laspinema sp. D3a]MCT7996806.1 hypothetical protein [Laspinema sp. D3c]
MPSALRAIHKIEDMFPMYLLSLLLVVAALWILHTTSQDIYTILAGGSAGILLSWGLALAPWSI